MKPRPEAYEGGHTGPPPSRLHVSAVSEPAAGRDEQLGQIFRNMRLAMRVPREAIARRLATSSATIDNFEAGVLTALPHWKETQRIVRAYCELLRLDPEPILWRVRSQLQALASQARPPRASPTVPPQQAGVRTATRTAQPAGRTEASKTRPARRRRRARALFAISAPIALIAGLVYLAQVAPRPVYRAIALLPDALEVPLRAGLEYVTLLTAPRRDGLRWIESDPQSRKADKLPIGTR